MNSKSSPLTLAAVLLLGVSCAFTGAQTRSVASTDYISPEKPSLEMKPASPASAPTPAAKPTVEPGLIEKPVSPVEKKTGQTSLPVAQAEAEKQAFDMDVLIERLKKTEVIGFFSKLALRSDATDLVDSVKQFKANGAQPKSKLMELRASFNGLVLKVLALLNDDPELAQSIRTAQNEIWNNLLEVET